MGSLLRQAQAVVDMLLGSTEQAQPIVLEQAEVLATRMPRSSIEIE